MKKKLLLFVVVLAFAVLSIGLLTACPNGTVSPEGAAFIEAVNALPTASAITLDDKPAVDSAHGLYNAISVADRTHADVVAARTTLNGLQNRLTELQNQADTAALNSARQAAVTRFTDAFSYRFSDLDLYSEANRGVLNNLRQAQIDAINAMNLATATAFTVEGFNWTAFDAVLTLAEEQQLLDDAIDAAVTRFTNAFNFQFNPAHYNDNDNAETGWLRMQAIFNAEVSRIQALTTIAAANAVVAPFNWAALGFNAVYTIAQETLRDTRAQLVADFNAAVAEHLQSADFMQGLTLQFGVTSGEVGTPIDNFLSDINNRRLAFVSEIATKNQAAVDAVVVVDELNRIIAEARIVLTNALQAEIDALRDYLNAWFSSAFDTSGDPVMFTDDDGTHEVLAVSWGLVQAELNYWLDDVLILDEFAINSFVILNATNILVAISSISALALLPPELAQAHNYAVAAFLYEFNLRFNLFVEIGGNNYENYFYEQRAILLGFKNAVEARIRALLPRSASHADGEFILADVLYYIDNLDFSDNSFVDWTKFNAVPTAVEVTIAHIDSLFFAAFIESYFTPAQWTAMLQDLVAVENLLRDHATAQDIAGHRDGNNFLPINFLTAWAEAGIAFDINQNAVSYFQGLLNAQMDAFLLQSEMPENNWHVAGWNLIVAERTRVLAHVASLQTYALVSAYFDDYNFSVFVDGLIDDHHIPARTRLFNQMLEDYFVAADLGAIDMTAANREALIAQRQILITQLENHIALREFYITLDTTQQIRLFRLNLEVLAYWTASAADFNNRLIAINAFTADTGSANYITLSQLRGLLIDRMLLSIVRLAEPYFDFNAYLDGQNIVPVLPPVGVITQIDIILTTVEAARTRAHGTVDINKINTISSYATVFRVSHRINALDPIAQTIAGVSDAVFISAGFVDYLNHVESLFPTIYNRLVLSLARHALFVRLQGYVNALNAIGTVGQNNAGEISNVQIQLNNIETFFTQNVGFPLSIAEELIVEYARNQLLVYWSDAFNLDLFNTRLIQVREIIARIQSNGTVAQISMARYIYGNVITRMLNRALDIHLDAVLQDAVLLDIQAIVNAIGDAIASQNINVNNLITVTVGGVQAQLIVDYRINYASVNHIRDFIAAVPVIRLNVAVLAINPEDINPLPPQFGIGTNYAIAAAQVEEARLAFTLLTPNQQLLVYNSLYAQSGLLVSQVQALVNAIMSVAGHSGFVNQANALIASAQGTIHMGNFANILGDMNALIARFNSNEFTNAQRLELADVLNYAVYTAANRLRAVMALEILEIYNTFRLTDVFIEQVRQEVTPNLLLLGFEFADLVGMSDFMIMEIIEALGQGIIGTRINNALFNYRALLIALGYDIYTGGIESLERIETVRAIYDIAIVMIAVIDTIDDNLATVLVNLDLTQADFSIANWTRVQNSSEDVITDFSNRIMYRLGYFAPSDAFSNIVMDIVSFDVEESLTRIINAIPSLRSLTQAMANNVFGGGTPAVAALELALGQNRSAFFGSHRLSPTGTPGVIGDLLSGHPPVTTRPEAFIVDHIELNFYRQLFIESTLSLPERAETIPVVRRMYWHYARHASSVVGGTTFAPGNIMIASEIDGAIGGGGVGDFPVGWLVVTANNTTIIENIDCVTGYITSYDPLRFPARQIHAPTSLEDDRGWVIPLCAAGAAWYMENTVGLRRRSSQITRLTAASILNLAFGTASRDTANRYSLTATVIPTAASRFRPSPASVEHRGGGAAAQWGGSRHIRLVEEDNLIAAANALGTAVYENAFLDRLLAAETAMATVETANNPLIIPRSAVYRDGIRQARENFNQLEIDAVNNFISLANAFSSEFAGWSIEQIVSHIDEILVLINLFDRTQDLVLDRTRDRILDDTIEFSAAAIARARLSNIVDTVSTALPIMERAFLAAVNDIGNITVTMPGFNPVGTDSWANIYYALFRYEQLPQTLASAYVLRIAEYRQRLEGYIQTYHTMQLGARTPLTGWVANGGAFYPTAGTGIGFLRPGGAAGPASAQIRSRDNDAFIKGMQVFIFDDSRDGALTEPGDLAASIATSDGYFWMIWGPKHGLDIGWWVVPSDFINEDGTRNMASPASRRMRFHHPYMAEGFIAADWTSIAVASSANFMRLLSHEVEGFSSGSRTFRFAARLAAYTNVGRPNPFTHSPLSLRSPYGFSVDFTA